MEHMHLCTSDDDGDRYSDYTINEDDDDDAEVVMMASFMIAGHCH